MHARACDRQQEFQKLIGFDQLARVVLLRASGRVGSVSGHPDRPAARHFAIVLVYLSVPARIGAYAPSPFPIALLIDTSGSCRIIAALGAVAQAGA